MTKPRHGHASPPAAAHAPRATNVTLVAKARTIAVMAFSFLQCAACGPSVAKLAHATTSKGLPVRIRSRKSVLAGVLLLALSAGNAAATPLLQLYIEGATYDSAKESWYIPSHDFRLWAIADVTGPEGAGVVPITNVRLAVVYTPIDPTKPVTVTLTRTRIGGDGSYMGFTDPSTPTAPTPAAPVPVTDGSTPLIGGNHHLPNHGEYGAGKAWQEFLLGTFDMPDSQLADFVHSFPTPGAFAAQINAYDVHVENADGHFDLYGQYEKRGNIHYVFAPPSHDATDGPESITLAAVPVPATLALLGIGAVGLGIFRRKSR